MGLAAVLQLTLTVIQCETGGPTSQGFTQLFLALQYTLDLHKYLT